MVRTNDEGLNWTCCQISIHSLFFVPKDASDHLKRNAESSKAGGTSFPQKGRNEEQGAIKTNDRKAVPLSANRSRSSGQPWDADDYDVRHSAADGPIVGRIYRARHRAGDQWFWGITTTPSSGANNGYAGTREAGMAALKARWGSLRSPE